uniref:Uncharacterized protein n=1 Tax=Anguilla anguilla TaxID=7936 RepID=A0A0E9WFY8_ANGAN
MKIVCFDIISHTTYLKSGSLEIKINFQSF